MPSLNSSCLAWGEYDSGTMHPRFRNGCTHTLPGASPHHYDSLLNSTSPGLPSVPSSSPKARQAIKADQGESSPIKAKRTARGIQTTCSKCATIAVDLKR